MVRHSATWPPVPIKLPSEIPKFEGKAGEDLGSHITTFHLWFSSNSLNNDSIWLRLFERKLNNVVFKWYIELSSHAYDRFLDLATLFLNEFQLPVQYDASTYLLFNF